VGRLGAVLFVVCLVAGCGRAGEAGGDGEEEVTYEQ
jgi:hypothetical protein